MVHSQGCREASTVEGRVPTPVPLSEEGGKVDTDTKLANSRPEAGGGAGDLVSQAWLAFSTK